MIRKIYSSKLGTSDIGWLKSRFHFSFADYYNPENINFGTLRVLNDDQIFPNSGFDIHPHNEMEIISYVVDGKLTHSDNMGNKNAISRGDIQYMSAGTGVWHSEFNRGQEILRFLQIWIIPDKKGYNPSYGDFPFAWESRKNSWLHMVSDPEGGAPIKIHQDCNIYSLELEAGKEIQFPVNEERQAYLVQIEGSSDINGIDMTERDAMEIIGEPITIKASKTSHILLIEMKKV
ncbi:pirin family protein [Parasporobacterium paucivorans]|nr:pirin family protein [Parasporobacterium paucivorans]